MRMGLGIPPDLKFLNADPNEKNTTKPPETRYGLSSVPGTVAGFMLTQSKLPDFIRGARRGRMGKGKANGE